jgi:hypothetical protein
LDGILALQRVKAEGTGESFFNIAMTTSIAIKFNYEVHMVHSQKDENLHEDRRTNYKLSEKVNQ